MLIELYPEKVIGLGIELTREQEEKLWQDMLDDGFRATLQVQSLVTGQLVIDLDFHPGAPLNFHGLEEFNLPTDIIEIPTAKSSLQEFAQKIERIPLDQIVDDLRISLKGIKEIINSPEIAKSLTYLEETMRDARNLLRHIDQKIDPLTASLTQTSDSARRLVNNVNRRVGPVQTDLAETTKEFRAALNAAEGALESVDDMVDENSEFRFQVDTFLSEITLMARSLRAFADYLERNPDALLRGKVKRAGQK